MKKVALLLIVLLSFWLAGCTGGGTTGPAASAATESVPAAPSDPLAAVDPTGVTVEFWHQHTREREAELNAMVEEFNATNEWGITVEAEFKGDYPDLYDSMIGGLRVKVVPDLVAAYQNQAAAYQFAEGLVDLTPYIESPTWGLSSEARADFFQRFIESDFNAAYDAQLGFPPNRSMEVLYYNQTLLSELGYEGPPTDWETFREMACAARTAGYIGLDLTLDASRVAAMIFSRGGEMMSADQSRYTLDTPEAIETMAFLRSMAADRCLSRVTERFGEQSNFGAGKSLFTLGSSSSLPFMEQAVAEGYAGEWGVAALPHSTPDPVQNIYGASVSIPETTPEEQLAAWLFVRWFTEPTQQARWARASNYFPVRRSTVAELEDYFADNPAYASAFELLEYGKPEPPVAGYDAVRDLIRNAMIDVIDGADPATTLAEVNEQANSNLAEFQP